MRVVFKPVHHCIYIECPIDHVLHFTGLRTDSVWDDEQYNEL